MDQVLVVDNQTFTLVREQRSGISLYRGGDSYLRLGPANRIEKELRTHRAMQDADYPVAAVVASGRIGDKEYFIERSLGRATFRTLFEEDIVASGAIPNKRFNDFIFIVEQFLVAEAGATVKNDTKSFAKGIHLDLATVELPQYSFSLPDKVQRVLKKLEKFPFVLSHGDFNPANLFPSGVIDFEDSFPAPFGYDAVTALATIDWMPLGKEYEFVARYAFTTTQRNEYLAMCDEVSLRAGYPAISAYYDDFSFCRALWSIVKMQEWPKVQAWRYEKFIKTYLFS